MKKLMVAVVCALGALASFAAPTYTDFTWTGGAGDGKWSSVENWQLKAGGAASRCPSQEYDRAYFGGDATVEVDGSAAVVVKQVSVTKGKVTLNAPDGAWFKIIRGYNANISDTQTGGYNVAAGAVLNLYVKTEMAGRTDFNGAGTINYHGEVYGASGSNYISANYNNFGDGFRMTQNVIFAIGSATKPPFEFNFTGNATVDMNPSIVFSAGSDGTAEGKAVQNGADTLLKTVNNLVVNSAGKYNPQYYTLKNGSINVGGSLYAGLAAGKGDFTQEGGTVYVKGVIKPQYGNVYLKGGTMTAMGGVNNDGKAGQFYVTGGTLKLGGTVATAFAARNARIHLYKGLTLTKGITIEGGSLSLADDYVYAGPACVTAKDAALVVSKNCTWAELQAKYGSVTCTGSTRFVADSPVTVTFPAGSAVPASFVGDANITVAIGSMADVGDDTTLVAGEVTLPKGATLGGKVNLGLVTGEYTYADIAALEPKSFENAGATLTITTNDTDTVDMTVKLTGGVTKFTPTAVLKYGKNGKFVFNGGFLNLPGDMYTLPILLAAIPHEGSKLAFVSDRAGGTQLLFTSGTSVLPDSLEVGAGITVIVPQYSQLVAATDVPPVLTVRNGGKFQLHGNSACIAAPIDLTLDEGSQLAVDVKDKYYARAMVVAHSYTLKGVKKPVGRYYSSTNEFRSAQGNLSAICVPYTWTGAGDGKSIDDLDNWEGRQFCEWTSYCTYDFSRATNDIEVGTTDGRKAYSYVMGGLSYLPPATRDGATVRLVKSGIAGADPSFNIRGPGDGCNAALKAVAFCRKGCTMDFGIKFATLDAVTMSCYNGGGTYRFSGGLTTKKANYFCVDGYIDVAGPYTTTEGKIRYTEMYDSRDPADAFPGGHMTFADGAAVTATIITLEHGDGFTIGEGYRQTGGSVSAGSIYMTMAKRNDGAVRNTYTLEDGTITLANALCIGSAYPEWPTEKVRADGNFNMTGGTLTTPVVSNECNNTYCRLLGGKAYIGAGGFVKSTAPDHDNPSPNKTAPLVLGDVTLYATDASWAIAQEIFVDLQGAATFDVAAGQAVTVNGAVAGDGGLTKAGDGALTVSGTYAAAGDIAVKGGTLTFTQPVELTVSTVELASTDALVLASGSTIATKSLCIDGDYKGTGEYQVGGGTITVAGGATWKGESGGNWSDTANWSGGQLPTATDEVFFKMPASGPLAITVDAAANAGRLTIRSGTVNFGGDGALTLGEGGELNVADGASLAFDATVLVTVKAAKTGKGAVAFNGELRNAADTIVWTALGTNEFKVVQGEAVVSGTVKRLRVYPCSNVEADAPLLTIADGAVMTDQCYVHGPWAGYNGTGYGDVVMNGGEVNLQAGQAVFGDNGRDKPEQSSKYGFAFFKKGKASFTMNGGVLRSIDGYMCLNVANTNGDGGTCTITLNGGSMYIHSNFFFGTQNSAVDTFVMNGGQLGVGLFCAGSGWGRKIVKLNGGEVTGHKITASAFPEAPIYSGIERIFFSKGVETGRAFDPVEIGGDVVFKQTDADTAFVFGPQVKFTYADAKLKSEGPGTVEFRSVPEGEFAVELNNGAKVGLAFEGTKEVGFVKIGSRLRPAGDYGEGARMPERFPGGGILRALTGIEPLGLMLMVR